MTTDTATTRPAVNLTDTDVAELLHGALGQHHKLLLGLAERNSTSTRVDWVRTVPGSSTAMLVELVMSLMGIVLRLIGEVRDLRHTASIRECELAELRRQNARLTTSLQAVQDQLAYTQVNWAQNQAAVMQSTRWASWLGAVTGLVAYCDSEPYDTLSGGLAVDFTLGLAQGTYHFSGRRLKLTGMGATLEFSLDEDYGQLAGHCYSLCQLFGLTTQIDWLRSQQNGSFTQLVRTFNTIKRLQNFRPATSPPPAN